MAIYEITIRRADGSLYWADGFNSKAEAEKWLAVERTRPYWDESFTVEHIDRAQEYADQAAANEAARIAREQARLQKKAQAKAIKDKPNKNQKDLEDLVAMLFAEVFGE